MEGPNTSGETYVVKVDMQRKVRNNDLSIKLTELTGKSQILQNFARVEPDSVNTLYASCKTCLVLVKYTRKSETSGLRAHTCNKTLIR